MTLLALAMCCEKCGTRPNLRISPNVRERLTSYDPDEVLGTWQCQNCGETDVITARALQEAAA